MPLLRISEPPQPKKHYIRLHNNCADEYSVSTAPQQVSNASTHTTIIDLGKGCRAKPKAIDLKGLLLSLLERASVTKQVSDVSRMLYIKLKQTKKLLENSSSLW